MRWLAILHHSQEVGERDHSVDFLYLVQGPSSWAGYFQQVRWVFLNLFKLENPSQLCPVALSQVVPGPVKLPINIKAVTIRVVCFVLGKSSPFQVDKQVPTEWMNSLE